MIAKKNVKFEAEDKTQNPFMIPLQATKEEKKKRTRYVTHQNLNLTHNLWDFLLAKMVKNPWSSMERVAAAVCLRLLKAPKIHGPFLKVLRYPPVNILKDVENPTEICDHLP